ncbi:MAG: serine hydroxymethyltransferase [Dehalococcoidia bacterium]|nr:serine hydroxymethyltransferase [Dehalococcoidia bacterium]
MSLQDPELVGLLREEHQRQRETLDLIAAENHAGLAILEVQGSVLTNKYAEGYPGSRYYAGCGVIDQVETLACRRACVLYGAEHANVQPHSGAQANMAVYQALLQPGDTVMAMRLTHGGHLTHGAPVNFSGHLYKFVSYGVESQTELLDYDMVEKLAREHMPRLIVAGASSYPRTIDFAHFATISQAVGARLSVDMAHLAGLIAAGVHPSPVPHADVVTSTSHKTLRGPRGGFILCRQELAHSIDAAVFPGIQGGPLMHAIAAKAAAFHEAAQPEFAVYQRQVAANARALAATFVQQGIRLVSGGTDNHMVLLDVTTIGITGRQAETALEATGLVANRNVIPFDPNPPQVAGGLRLGTPAVTNRGLKEEEMAHLGGLICRILRSPGDEATREEVRGEVAALCRRFPIP